jgi:hypothetical protein
MDSMISPRQDEWRISFGNYAYCGIRSKLN